MTYNVLLEDLITRLGGCGLYQWLLAAIVHVGKTMATWSMITMTFSGQDPGFWCADDVTNGSMLLNDSTKDKCELNTTGSCGNFRYDESMYTVVSEWDLVCDRKWVGAIITTIQMAGVLVGCFIAGHLADLIGRKPTYFLSVVLIVIFNVVAYFSVSWEMYAAIRCLIGVGIGFYLTVQYNLIIELAPAKWRPALCVVPSWSLEASAFALVAWGLHDWKKIHLAIAVLAAPFLLTYWFVPESFRWLVTQKKFKDAERVVSAIAKTNRKDVPDISKVVDVAMDESKTETPSRKYSALDLFREPKIRNTSIGLLFVWFASSYGYYGITFGVKSLSGDLYMNMFLINIVEVPGMLLCTGLVNWFGRKRVCMAFYILAGITGIVTGVFQYLDNPYGGQVTNAIAILSKIGVACGWQAMIVFTTELYPTVVRTIAYGVHSTSARLGGMVAPQVVFLDDLVHGVLYFISGVLMMLSAAILVVYEETKGKVLDDTLEGDTVVVIATETQNMDEDKHEKF